MKSAEKQVFEGVSEGGQGRGWCRRVGGSMRHTQLRIGVQGGRVEHRGETEVKVVQSGEQGGRQKKTVENKKDFWSLVPSLKSIAQPNQEDALSGSTFGPHVPQEMVYMGTRGRLVYYIGTLFPQEFAQTTFFR